MFLNEMGGSADEIPEWDAISRRFWSWYSNRQDEVILRFLWLTVRFSHPKIRAFVTRVFGPEPAA